jgi:hypothetical protein
MDAETAVTELTALLRERPQTKDVHFWAQLPGEPVDSGCGSLRDGAPRHRLRRAGAPAPSAAGGFRRLAAV